MQYSVGICWKAELASGFNSSVHEVIRALWTAKDYDRLLETMAPHMGSRNVKADLALNSPSKCLDFSCGRYHYPFYAVKEGKIACGKSLCASKLPHAIFPSLTS